MWQLAGDVSLDQNSPYHYVLFGRDFAQTSVVARRGEVLAGFVTGFERPDEPGVLFVWQVAVAEAWRGAGVGGRMLDHLADRLAEGGLHHVEATVTPDNAASIRLFEAFARRHGALARWSSLFGAELFPGAHEREDLVRVGPLADVLS